MENKSRFSKFKHTIHICVSALMIVSQVGQLGCESVPRPTVEYEKQSVYADEVRIKEPKPQSLYTNEAHKKLMDSLYKFDDKLAEEGKSCIKMTVAYPNAEVKILQLPPKFAIHSTGGQEGIEWFTRCITEGKRVDGPEGAVIDPGLYGVVMSVNVKRTSPLGREIAVSGYNREWIFFPHYETKQCQAVLMGPVVEGTIFMPPRVNNQWLANGIEEVMLSVQKAKPEEMELALFMRVPLEKGQRWICEDFQILPPISTELKRGQEIKR